MAMNHSKLSLAVIFGGVSSEHEVSRMSATSILENLSPEQYDVHMVGITKKGQWLLYTGEVKDILSGAWEQGPVAPAFLSPDPTVHGLVVLRDGKAETLRLDVIFPALHGKNGEDGTIQGLFQLSQIPYVGCDTESSAICMDKAVTHTLLSAADIEQAHYLWFYADRFDAAPDTIKKKIKARLDSRVRQAANAGSSVGVSEGRALRGPGRGRSRKGCPRGQKSHRGRGHPRPRGGVRRAGQPGRPSLYCGGDWRLCPVLRHDDKYVNGTSQLYIPARLDEEVAEKIRRTAVRAYRLLGCSGLTRVDFFVTEGDHRVVLNELNTLPGFTSISMYPKLWMAMGLTYGELLDKLIDLAFQKAGQERP